MPPNIPTLDPNPLPADYWVFKLLLVTTFFLHLIAMNLMLGGGVLALVAKWGSRNRERGDRIFGELAKKAPVFLPATITLGIAPLLFLQAIYGQFFFTSSILMAWPWFLALVFLTIAYYGFYYVSYRGGKSPGKAAWVMLMSVILVLFIGFLFSNNTTLSQTPARWAAKYFASPAGWNLNLSEPTLIPRYLHFVVAAVAMGGLLLVFMAWANWKKDRGHALHLLRFGGKTFNYATMAQFVVGIALLASLPRELRMLFLGDNLGATALLLIGVGGGLASIFLMSDALRRENIRIAAIYVPAILAVVIASMSVMRDNLRDAYLKDYFHPQQFVVKTQWSVFPFFLGLFVVGAILWVVMLRRYGVLGGPNHCPKASQPLICKTGRLRPVTRACECSGGTLFCE